MHTTFVADDDQVGKDITPYHSAPMTANTGDITRCDRNNPKLLVLEDLNRGHRRIDCVVWTPLPYAGMQSNLGLHVVHRIIFEETNQGQGRILGLTCCETGNAQSDDDDDE